MEPCSQCGRTLRRVVQEMGLEERRGRERFCQVPNCPIYERWTGLMPTTQVKGRHAFGPSPPSLFIGRYGYPEVNAGPLVTPAQVDDPALMDAPPDWTGMELGDVLALRSGLLRSSAKVKVTDATELVDPTRAMEVSRELAMAIRPADTELEFTKDVDLQLSPQVAGFSAPTGPRVSVKRAELAENPVVPRKVDQIVTDTDAKAVTGATELYEHGTTTYQLQRLLSAGLLGQAKDRRLVPTRWSITATDDMIGKRLIDELRDRQPLGRIQLHAAEMHGNRFHVLLLPGPWTFEMVEAWMVSQQVEVPTEDGTRWELRRGLKVLSDWEPYDGRTSYADDVTGAYYAARLSVLEHLVERGRQASVLVMREITDAYFAPAGVWVIREGVAKAMGNDPRTPETLEGALGLVTKENVQRVEWGAHSKVVDLQRHQTRLADFL